MSSSPPVLVEIAIGELADKISILEIKQARLTDCQQLNNVDNELQTLRHAWSKQLKCTGILEALCDDLRAVNTALWDIEDDIRKLEASGDFGARFVTLARSVYTTNDRRAAIKREINNVSGSRLREEKSYEDY
jgi:hypothetical protein